jgi:hypothetical protein
VVGMGGMRPRMAMEQLRLRSQPLGASETLRRERFRACTSRLGMASSVLPGCLSDPLRVFRSVHTLLLVLSGKRKSTTRFYREIIASRIGDLYTGPYCIACWSLSLGSVSVLQASRDAFHLCCNGGRQSQ